MVARHGDFGKRGRKSGEGRGKSDDGRNRTLLVRLEARALETVRGPIGARSGPPDGLLRRLPDTGHRSSSNIVEPWPRGDTIWPMREFPMRVRTHRRVHRWEFN
jgi:hypothetical protein